MCLLHLHLIMLYVCMVDSTWSKFLIVNDIRGVVATLRQLRQVPRINIINFVSVSLNCIHTCPHSCPMSCTDATCTSFDELLSAFVFVPKCTRFTLKAFKNFSRGACSQIPPRLWATLTSKLYTYHTTASYKQISWLRHWI